MCSMVNYSKKKTAVKCIQIALCWNSWNPTFQVELYDDYKFTLILILVLSILLRELQQFVHNEKMYLRITKICFFYYHDEYINKVHVFHGGKLYLNIYCIISINRVNSSQITCGTGVSNGVVRSSRSSLKACLNTAQLPLQPVFFLHLFGLLLLHNMYNDLFLCEYSYLNCKRTFYKCVIYLGFVDVF